MKLIETNVEVHVTTTTTVSHTFTFTPEEQMGLTDSRGRPFLVTKIKITKSPESGRIASVLSGYKMRNGERTGEEGPGPFLYISSDVAPWLTELADTITDPTVTHEEGPID
jgi:hypothetical protein